MAFETGNPQFNFLLKRARSRKQTADALKNNNIDVETSKEKMEEGGESSDVSGGSQIGDIGGLSQSTGIGVTDTGFSQSIADANEMADRGVGGGKSVGEVAFGISKDKGIADFSASNPVGAAIAGYSSSKMAQTAVNMAPMGLALAGQMEAARALSQVTSVMGGPIGSLAMGLVGPSMQDPYGNTVAMGSGMLGAVSNQVMGMHYGIAEKAAAGVPGYAGGTYNGTALSVSPGFFGGLTFTGVNAPDIHSYSPTDFMNDLATAKAYSASVEPFGGLGSTSIGGQGISVDTFSSPTQAAQNNTGYSSYGPTGIATGAAPPGSQFSSTGIFSGSQATADAAADAAQSAANDAANAAGENNDSGNSSNSNNSGSNAGVDGPSGEGSEGGDSAGQGGEDVAFGGKITKKKKMAMGDVVEQNPEVVQGVGFIDHDNNATPQEEIKDDKPLEAKEGDFIINAPAAEFMGKQDVEEMISVAVTSLQEKGVDVQIGNPEISTEDNVKLLVSKNEVYIPKVIAEEIGYDKLEKINNRGKKEVSRRQQEAEQTQDEKPQARQVAEGGFIGMQEGGDVVTDDDDGGMDIMEQMNPNTIKKIKGLMKRGINRGSIEALIDNLPDREALALTIFSESIVSKDSPDSMRAIGETVLNRVNDKTYSFKNQNTLKDVLKSRSNKGEGSKMFSYEGLEPKYLTPRLPEMLNNKYWQKALDAADNALETEPDMEQYKLRDDVFTYGRVGEASDRLKSNKRNEYLTTIGEHDFYSRTPEKGGRISSETMGESSEFYR